MERDFEKEYFKFIKKIREKENFALVRFGDGEIYIVNGYNIDISKKLWGEHKYTNGEPADEEARKLLIDSLQYVDDNYYVGILCKCHGSPKLHLGIKGETKCKEENLTRATIFNHWNYQFVKPVFVPELKKRKVVFVCNENARTGLLPFHIEKTFTVGKNSWITGRGVIEEVREYMQGKKDYIVLFCVGVLSNIAVHQLYKEDKNNTYIDLGSIFDDMMGLGKTRSYHSPHHQNSKVKCIW